jgi:hypothetical protein
MLIIDCDFHTRYQQITMAEEDAALKKSEVTPQLIPHAFEEARALAANVFAAMRQGLGELYPLKGCARGDGLLQKAIDPFPQAALAPSVAE